MDDSNKINNFTGYLRFAIDNDPDLLIYYDVMPPMNPAMAENLLRSKPGKYFGFYEIDSDEWRNEKEFFELKAAINKICLGIGGFINWCENRNGADLFISIPHGILKSKPELYKICLNNAVMWYFNNQRRENVFLEFMENKERGEAIDSLHPYKVHYEGEGTLWARGKENVTMRYKISKV